MCVCVFVCFSSCMCGVREKEWSFVHVPWPTMWEGVVVPNSSLDLMFKMAAKQGTIFKCLSEASCSLQRSCYVSPLSLFLSLFLLPMHSPENTRRWGTYITVRLVSSFTSLDSTAFLHTTIFFFGQIQSCYKLETSGQSYKHFTIVNYNSRVVMCANL